MAFLAACWVLFFLVVQPTVDGKADIRLGADSATYFQYADLIRGHLTDSNQTALISFGGNLLGPVAIALLLKTAFWVAVFNCFLFVIAISCASQIRGVNRWLFFALLAINAETAVSLITLNKEILALLSLVLFAKYVHSENRSWLLLGTVLLISVLARWEQALAIVAFLFFQRNSSVFSTRPKLALATVVVAITLAYPLLLRSAAVDLEGFVSQGEGGNTIAVLDRIQASYGFPLVVMPKILMNLAGRLITPSYFIGDYLSEDFSDLQNQIAIHLHEIATVCIFAVALARRKLKASMPIPFFIALYLIMTAVSPFIQPRYEYPIYVLLALELSHKEGVLHGHGAEASPGSPL
ncbi:MAG TPA: hypothetical protein VGR96_17905 [Acidobacteriaceae bacterium]|nr:hypothetical protein [Acidobacteriaceae bacterium]